MGVDFECDLALEANESKWLSESISGFRNNLLSEHLNVLQRVLEESISKENSVIRAIERLKGPGRTLRKLDINHGTLWVNFIPDISTLDPDEPFDTNMLYNVFSPDKKHKTRFSFVRIPIVAIFVLSALAMAWGWVPMGDWGNSEFLSDIREYLQTSPLSPMILLAVFVLGSMACVPVLLMIVFTVIAMGPIGGAFYAMLGSLLGASVTYGIGRVLGRDTLRRMVGKHINRFSGRLAKYGVTTMTAVRLLPIAPFSIVNMVAGAHRFRFEEFILGTITGMTPGIILIALLIFFIESAFRRPGLLNYALAILMSVITFAYPIFIFFRFNKKRTDGTGME
jgi:uncharacterized membrane protein YdjX (TVP38/TMEM64 family)